MAETLDATLSKINDTLDKLLVKLGGTPSGGTIGAEKDATGKETQRTPTEFFKLAGDALGTVATEASGIAIIFKAITGDKDPIMSVFKEIAKSGMRGQAVQMLEGAIAPNRAAMTSGKDSDFVKQAAQEKGTTVTYADLQKMMSQAQPGMTGAGNIQNDRVDNTYATLQKLIEENKGQIASGATTQQELAKALLVTQTRSRNDLGTNAGQAKAVEAATKYAQTINEVALKTGDSRDVIAENNFKMRMKGDEQALVMSMNTQQQRDSYIKAQAGMSGMGENFQKLAKELTISGAPVTPEAQATATAIGPKATMELRDAMLALKTATTEDSRKRAEEKLQQAKDSASERQRDPMAQKMAMYADMLDEPLLKGFGQQFEQNREAPGYLYNRNQGATPGEASGIINDQVGNLQAGKQQGGGERTSAMQLQQELTAGNTEAAIKAGDAYREFNKQLNTNTGIVDGIVKGIQGATKPAPKPAESTGAKPVQESEPEKPLKQSPSRVPPVPRDIGTLGKTGASFEPKDVIALLHKGERVLSPSENSDLTNLFGMVSDLKPKSNLGGALSNIKPPAGDTAEVGEEATGESSGDTVADSSGITLKDLNDSLQQLNSNIELMVSHTADMKDSTRETADMSGKMTGNRFAV
jgi:hypothetical protein